MADNAKDDAKQTHAEADSTTAKQGRAQEETPKTSSEDTPKEPPKEQESSSDDAKKKDNVDKDDADNANHDSDDAKDSDDNSSKEESSSDASDAVVKTESSEAEPSSSSDEPEEEAAEEPKSEPKSDQAPTSDEKESPRRKAAPAAAKSSDDILSTATEDAIREQIENCKNELEIALTDKIKYEFEKGAIAAIKKADRRRRISNLMHDIVIMLLIAVAVYFGFCLYDAHYFDFMKTPCEREGTCETKKEDEKEPENNPTKDVLKDLDWYVENYGYLFDNLRTELNADSVDAYYFYSGDYKVSNLRPSYLLSMAYGRTQPDFDTSSSVVSVPGSAMRTAFAETFGNLTYYVPGKFTHGCQKFVFSQDLDLFTANYDVECTKDNTHREIVEVITEMREEGNVLYIFTTAAIFDQQENAFYTFDDIFHPAVMGVKKDDLKNHSGTLNNYQYQFKKTDEEYHFDAIVKLR